MASNKEMWMLIFVIFIPYVAVLIKDDFDSDQMMWAIIAFVLSFCFWIPGVVFAAWYVYMR